MLLIYPPCQANGRALIEFHDEYVLSVGPSQSPDINKMSILADVAPYSREYQKYAGIVRHHSQYDSDLRAEYERIQEQVRQWGGCRGIFPGFLIGCSGGRLPGRECP